MLAEQFRSVQALRDASLVELQQTREVGPVLAASVRQWFDQPENQRLLDRLTAAGVRVEMTAAARAASIAACIAARGTSGSHR